VTNVGVCSGVIERVVVCVDEREGREGKGLNANVDDLRRRVLLALLKAA
jgi:hypothetical protein